MATTVNCPQKLTIPIGSLKLECGRRLQQVEIAVETAGTLNESRDNVILVCHALTGDAHAVGVCGSPRLVGRIDRARRLYRYQPLFCDHDQRAGGYAPGARGPHRSTRRRGDPTAPLFPW